MGSELDDIPGTTVFTGQMCRRGLELNRFCMSLMKAENRARFSADESAYLDEWRLDPRQRAAVENRDYNAAIAAGGNIFYLAKIFFVDGLSTEQGVASMTGMTAEEYRAMMVSGGRRPEGWRSIEKGA